MTIYKTKKMSLLKDYRNFQTDSRVIPKIFYYSADIEHRSI